MAQVGAIDRGPASDSAFASRECQGSEAKPIGKACLRCRKRKIRCDGGRPACGSCVRTNGADVCDYDNLNRRDRSRAQSPRERIERLEAELQRLRTGDAEFSTGCEAAIRMDSNAHPPRPASSSIACSRNSVDTDAPDDEETSTAQSRSSKQNIPFNEPEAEADGEFDGYMVDASKSISSSPTKPAFSQHAASVSVAQSNSFRGSDVPVAASPSAGTDAKDKERRVPLACFRCRAKRARCSGVPPRCKACETADVECQWPEGRRRKRTRKEMEEAERLEREAAAVAAAERAQAGSASTSRQTSPVQRQNIHRAVPWERHRFFKASSCLRILCQSAGAQVDISRLEDLKKDLSISADHAESWMGFLQTRRTLAISMLDLLHQAANNTRVADQLPEIRKLCLARMMELAVRIEDVPQAMRIDSDIIYLSKTVSYVARGGFGYIYRTKLNSDSSAVAVKVPKESIQERKKGIFREILLWSHLCHDNILAFKGVCEFRGRFPSVVSPWMERGAITDHCKKVDVHLSDKFALLGHVAKALDYLHNHDPQIVHEDVRGANILVNEVGNAVLSDFGISRINNEEFADMSSRLQHGNIRWAAPELLFSKVDRAPPKPRSETEISETDKNFTKASTHTDMWSFAMTIIEVITGRIPFADAIGRFDAAVVIHIYDRKLPVRPDVEKLAEARIPDFFWAAIESCWDEEPSRRPDASTMLTHLMTAEATICARMLDSYNG